MPVRMSSERLSEGALIESQPGLDLNLLMLFLDIGRAGSITHAAERHRVPKATLSRKLRQLEDQVGAVLVKRGPHGLELTDIGRALFERCERIAADVNAASLITSEMREELRGTMRISLPFGLGNTWISGALANFALKYPDVKLTIHVTNRWVDVSEEPYDVAIYIGKVRNEQLPVRKLMELPRGLYASPAYCERRGVPTSPANLFEHDCIVLESQLNDGLWTFKMTGNGTRTVIPRMRTTDIIVAREMAVAGVGVALLTHAVCEAEVKAGRLVRLLPRWRLPPVVVGAMFLERRHLPLRIRSFIDLLAEAIRSRGACG